MKKNLLMVLSVAFLLGMGACKPKESAYKAAYEKAQEKEIVEEVAEPAPAKPATTTPRPAERASNGKVTSERVTAVSGTLKAYNVVVGSFTVKTNALGLKDKLQKAGYDPVVAQNAKGMYRVIAASYDDRASAEDMRDSLRSQYPDAWLLLNQ